MTGGTKKPFYFNRQEDGRWMYYDQHGGGDMMLTVADWENHIAPQLDDISIRPNPMVFHYVNAVVDTVGWNRLTFNLKFYVTPDSPMRVDLLTVTNDLVLSDLSRFELRLVPFAGTPWPYPADTIEEDITYPPVITEVTGDFSRKGPTALGGYLIPVGSPDYGLSQEQLAKKYGNPQD